MAATALRAVSGDRETPLYGAPREHAAAEVGAIVGDEAITERERSRTLWKRARENGLSTARERPQGRKEARAAKGRAPSGGAKHRDRGSVVAPDQAAFGVPVTKQPVVAGTINPLNHTQKHKFVQKASSFRH